MKTLVLGKGFIANHLDDPKFSHFSGKLFNPSDIEKMVESEKPDIVINTIGFCGRPNVDECEIKKNETVFANTTLPLMMAESFSKHQIKMIHIGSWCVYFGNSPHWSEHTGENLGWEETDFANPLSFYSKSKYSTDLLLSAYDNVSTLRIRMPISWKNTERNYLNKIRKYDNILTSQNSMTLMSDFIRTVDFFLRKDLPGIYHVVNNGTLSAEDVLIEYNDLCRKMNKKHLIHNYITINEKELDLMTIAKRSNCKLSTAKLYAAGFDIAWAKDSLISTLERYIKSL